MELRYNFSEEEFLKLCLHNLEREKTTVFEDLYETFKHFLNFPDSLMITEVRHRVYPEHYDYCLSLKEYLEKGRMILPYVEFDISSNKDIELDITSIKLPSFLQLNSFQYGNGSAHNFIIKNTKLKTKNKSSIKLLSVEIPLALLTRLYSRMTLPGNLLPSKLGVWEWRQTFYNKMTGESFLCTCFKDALSKDRANFSLGHPQLTYALEHNLFKDSICHICTKENSNLEYCHKMYGSTFKIKYGAYIKKQSIEEGISERDAENKIRELKGVAKIGERWINETLLFNYISSLFPRYTIQREASPTWLNKQRFDIYIPKLNLAIEYQGQQHYEPVNLFGGEEGLERTRQRDTEKLRLSKLNNVDIIYFNYKENLTAKLVEKKLKNYI